MKKSIFMKLLVLALCAAMVLSLVACSGGTTEEASSAAAGTSTEEESTGNAGGETTEAQPGGESETQPGGESETQPGGESETQPGGESETQPGGETETKPGGETETDPVGPTCDGNHAIKDRGDQGHYEDACTICGTDRGTVEPHTFEDKNGKPTCTVCNYVASCQGIHTWQYNATEHWQDSCFVCGAAATAKSAHTMDHNAAGEYACTVCNYKETCAGNHALVSDGEAGHHEAACVVCNTPNGATVAHVFEDKNGSRICACGYEAACKGVHTWASDADGHQMAACNVCGAAAGEKVAHSDVKAEAVSATAYTYGCADCGYAFYTKNITAAVKQFLTPGYVATGAKVYYAIGSHEMKVAENGMPYASISGTGSTAQVIWVRAHEDMVWHQRATAAEQEGRFNIGKATYLVITLRTNNTEQKMSMSFSTTGKGSNTAVATEELKKNDITIAAGETYNTENGYCSFSMPISSATADTWTTFVIDLAKVCPEQLVADENGDYIVDTLYYHLDAFGAETTLDVAYMAFVEGNWAAVAANVDAETVVSVTASGIGTIVKAEDGSCIGEHNYVTAVVDGYYKSACACGATKDSYGVKAEGPDRFWGAEDMYGWASFTGTADKEVIYDEDGTGFVRFNNTTVNTDKWSDFHWSNSAAGATGQYMVMKYRIGENGLGQTSLSMYITSKPVSSWPKGGVTVKVSEDGQWHYLVIDLANRVATGGFEANEDGTYTVNYFSVRYFNGYQTLAQPDDYMDVSYVAFCDSIDDVKNIVDAETYEWSADANTTAIRYTADHSCAQHAWVEVVEGTTHNIKCSLCDYVENTYTISADVNWYSSLGDMNKYQHNLEKLIYDEEEGVMFNRYTGTGGNHINITGGTGAGSATSAKYSTGKYVVIKYRATGATLGFNVQTGDCTGGSVSLGTQSIANLPGDEWRVAIVDLTAAHKTDGKKASSSQIASGVKVDADGYLANEDGTRKMFNYGYTCESEQAIYFMLTTGGSTPYVVDIAYVAVVDSLDEMKMLLKDGETYVNFGTNWAGTPVEYDQDGARVPCKEGKCVLPAAATITDGENGAKVYTYTCTVCENVVLEKVVPAGVIYMAPEILKTVTNATVVNPNAEDANSPEVYATKSDLHPQTHFGMTGNAYAYDSFNGVTYFGFNGNNASHMTGQFIWNRSYEDQKGQAPGYGRYTLDMGASRYLVIKAQTEMAETSFEIIISTKGNSQATIKVPVQETQGEWVTYVIDLATVAADAWKVDETTGTYIMDTFYFNLYKFFTTDSAKLAYVAFVAGDWTNVDALVDDESVVMITDLAKGYDDVHTETGKVFGTDAVCPLDVTFDEWNMATVTIPANTTMYFSCWSLNGEMSLSANGEPIEFVAGNRWQGTPSTFSITNNGEEAMEYYLLAEYPAGHMENPEGLYAGDESSAVIEEGSQGYFFTYEAWTSGTLTLTFSSDAAGWTYVINDLTNYVYGDQKWSDSNPDDYIVVIEVKAGDVLQIMVNTYDPENEWVAPAGTVTVDVDLEVPVGTEDNPVQISESETKVTIPAGATYNFATRANGATLFINGVEHGVVSANMFAPYTFTITNDSEADVEYTVTLVFPKGIMENPDDLVIGTNNATVAAGSQGYYYTWIATADGTLTITVSADATGWMFAVNNLTSFKYGDNMWSDSDPVVNTVTIEVKAGDEIQIIVNTFDPENMWAAPEGTVTVTAAFEKVWTIPAILEAPVDTEITITGTVTGTYVSGKNSVYISDADGNKLLVFSPASVAYIGDVITVTGKVGAYEGVNQIAAGATVVVVTPHECQMSEADCLNDSKCSVCQKVGEVALGHDFVDGTCSRCSVSESAATTTVSKTMAELITANGWTSTTVKQSFTLDDIVSVKINGGSNTGKAYNGDHIRIYATDTPAGTITISVKEGYELVSIKITTQTGTYAFLCVDGATEDISNSTVTVSGSSVVINSVKNGSDGKQARVTGIEVTYAEVG